MSGVDISLIVTIYNQPLEDIFFTLASAVLQEDVVHEIIVADDASTTDTSSEIEDFFKVHGFSRYRIRRAAVNQKTVKNIRDAIYGASGKYIKYIGAGDILFSSTTLRDICRCLQENALVAGFGKVASFTQADSKIKAKWFEAPRNFYSYTLPARSSNQSLLAHQLKTADWIPGGAQFFERETYLILLDDLAGEFGLEYCEDFAATLSLASTGIEIAGFSLPVMWYEYGTGISTTGSKESVRRMYKDNERFYAGICRRRPYDNSYRIERAMFSLRQFIALKTPVYNFFKNVVARAYMKHDMDKALLPGEFFYSCREASKLF